MTEYTSQSFNAEADIAGLGGVQTPPPPDIDLTEYVAELRAWGLSDNQAAEFLATLVPLIWHFVDMGFAGDISELLLSWAEAAQLDSELIMKSDAPIAAESEDARS